MVARTTFWNSNIKKWGKKLISSSTTRSAQIEQKVNETYHQELQESDTLLTSLYDTPSPENEWTGYGLVTYF